MIPSIPIRYDDYLRDEHFWNRLEKESEREAADSVAWDAYVAEANARGELRTVERLLGDVRTYVVKQARSRGKNLKEAKIDAEFKIAAMKRLLFADGLKRIQGS